MFGYALRVDAHIGLLHRGGTEVQAYAFLARFSTRVRLQSANNPSDTFVDKSVYSNIACALSKLATKVWLIGNNAGLLR